MQLYVDSNLWNTCSNSRCRNGRSRHWSLADDCDPPVGGNTGPDAMVRGLLPTIPGLWPLTIVCDSQNMESVQCEATVVDMVRKARQHQTIAVFWLSHTIVEGQSTGVVGNRPLTMASGQVFHRLLSTYSCTYRKPITPRSMRNYSRLFVSS